MSADIPQNTLIVAGGTNDPNLVRLVDIATQTEVNICDLRHGNSDSPGFSWEIDKEVINLKSQTKVNGSFVRYDVFSSMNDTRREVSQRAVGWYQAIQGWLLSNPEIRLFNRYQTPIASNKVATLHLAQQVGLFVPKTSITNEVSRLKLFNSRKAIAKPIAGGDYCYPLDQLLVDIQCQDQKAAMPAIVQEKLVPPEVRIYIVGKYSFGFEICSPSLDYRINQDATIHPLNRVPAEVEPLLKLMSKLQMDFGAADFKTDPKTGQLVFLELNSSPMFVRFDQLVKGELCKAIVQELLYG